MSLSEQDEKFMKRCIDLARLGLGNTAPNPMVGSVIVHHGKIIGEGYHKQYGQAHAEVNAIQDVKNKKLFEETTLYVNLEPCAHMGKTPPCADLIVSHKIPRVVIGTSDPNSIVKGKGINKLRNAGVDVEVGVLASECAVLNKRFFTFHEKKRPYIILKWAESADGYIDIKRAPDTPVGPNWISNTYSRRLVHKWRAEEQAIMAGTNTIIFDNPQLNQRLWTGKSPLRIIIDRKNRIPDKAHVLDGSVKTILFTEKAMQFGENIEVIELKFGNSMLADMLNELYQREIQSVIVEGGKQLIESFYQQNLWDEARVFIGTKFFGDGIKAPEILSAPAIKTTILNDKLNIYKNSQ
jgi:diaminohydroxyphosphoribosylaminopyrimidine deaminase / 5-amino-6-(5-phosphoribosylamino)uracil reductase